MKKRTSKKSLSLGGQPSFNWQLQDETPRVPEPLTEVSTPRSQHGWLILTACALLTLLVGYWGGQWLTRRAEANLAQIEVEVSQAIYLQNIASQPITNTTPLVTTPLAMTDRGANVTLLELNGTLALVDLVVNRPLEVWYGEPYHVARIMRQDANGWKPIAPINTFWNDRRTLETAYFYLEYSQRDEHSVQAVAPQLDDLYLRLHTDLGIPPPRRNARMDILIAVVEGSDVRVADLRYSGNTLIVPPPDLLPRPLNLSNAETLRQAITFPLAVKVFDAAQSQLSDACNWRAVREGIGLWLRWEGHTLPSRRHWEYESVIKQWSETTAIPSLDDLLSIPRDYWQPSPLVLNAGAPMPRSELAATLIEYMVATHGRQFVPLLLHEISQYSDWNDLAQSTVQITADELEAGWQAHLRSRAR